MEDRQSLAYLESFVNTTVKKQINDKIRSSHLVSRKAVTVHEYNGVDNTASIIFPTDPDTPSIYYYPNRSGVALQKGQKVYLNYQVDNISQGWLELNEPLTMFRAKDIYDIVFPLGIIISNINDDFDPNVAFEGTTWIRVAGVFQAGRDPNDSESNQKVNFNKPGGTRMGSKWLAQHRHGWDGVNDGAASSPAQGNYPFRIYQDKNTNWNGSIGSMHFAGAGDSENIPPAIVTNFWQRTK